MREPKTISYVSDDKSSVENRSSNNSLVKDRALSESNLHYMRGFQRHLEDSNWSKALYYLKRLSKSSLFFAAMARSGFVIKNAAKVSRRELINRVIEQLNQRNKIRWLRDVSYESYLDMVADALYSEFRCDSVTAYFIIRDNKIRINRGWVQGLTPEETARSMPR